uniref:ANF_receptor domain-containing protein n=1 Tax=Heterorhabditis bacteriophora TaxID=37862 RepID=A0A1I7WMA0_HETBA
MYFRGVHKYAYYPEASAFITTQMVSSIMNYLFMNNSRIPQAIMVECEDAVWLGMATVVRFLFFPCFCHSDDFI